MILYDQWKIIIYVSINLLRSLLVALQWNVPGKQTELSFPLLKLKENHSRLFIYLCILHSCSAIYFFGLVLSLLTYPYCNVRQPTTRGHPFLFTYTRLTWRLFKLHLPYVQHQGIFFIFHYRNSFMVMVTVNQEANLNLWMDSLVQVIRLCETSEKVKCSPNKYQRMYLFTLIILLVFVY